MASDELLTPEGVRASVDFIRTVTHDPEVAHGAEDTLYHSILLAIATGRCSHPQLCAAIAVTTKEMDFERWRA